MSTWGRWRGACGWPGVDTAYVNDADDEALIERANTEQRVLLTQDRGLLRRRALCLGAYARGAHPDTELADVLDRFAPPLAPWTPVHRLQRPAPHRPQGRGGTAAAARHPAHLPGVFPLPGLRPGVLARRAQQTAAGPDRLGTARCPRYQPNLWQLAHSRRCERSR
jgi:Mut7-C RNAse domain